MASKKDKAAKAGVARLRERYYEIRRNIKISPELEEATREKAPVRKEEKPADERPKKIASPRREKDVEL